MMHYALGGDLNDVGELGAINEFAPSMPKNLAHQYSTPTEKSALRMLGASVATPSKLTAPRLKEPKNNNYTSGDWKPESYSNISKMHA
jgi:hypothetical protein